VIAVTASVALERARALFPCVSVYARARGAARLTVYVTNNLVPDRFTARKRKHFSAHPHLAGLQSDHLQGDEITATEISGIGPLSPIDYLGPSDLRRRESQSPLQMVGLESPRCG